MTTKPLTIGQLAKLANIGIETVRFYQKQKLIQEPVKPLQGYRVYPQETLSQLQFIQRAKRVGFTLAEIKKILMLGENSNCEQAKQMAEEKLLAVDEKVSELLNIKKSLEVYVDQCSKSNKDDRCPMIQSFNLNCLNKKT